MALRIDQKTRLLAALPVFQALEPEAVHVLSFSVRERRLAAGDTLFSRGAPSDGGFVVASGRIALDPSDSHAGIREFGPGALIGEVALVSETERPATAAAMEPSVVLVLPRQLIHQVLEAHPESAGRLRAYIAARLADTREAIRSLVG